MQSIGQVIPAFGLVGLSYVGCDMFMATVWLCICVGVNSAVYSGYQVNHKESRQGRVFSFVTYQISDA